MSSRNIALASAHARHLARQLATAPLFFTPLLLPAASSTWDGGAGTGLWGSDANWSSDSLPASTDSVVFAGASPTSIDLGGDRTIDTATFSSAAYVLDGGTLTASSGVSVISGSLQVGDGSTTGALTGPVALSSGASLIFARSDAIEYAAAISGSGSLTKSGSGNLTLSGSNSYSGDTTISAGTLTLAPTGFLGDGVYNGAISIGDGATLHVSTDYQELHGVISGAGGLTTSGDYSVLILAADNTYTGTTHIGASTNLILGSLSATGMIAGDIVVNGSLIFDHTVSRTYAGTLSGSGNVVKSGNETLTLTGSTSAPELNFYVYSGGLEFDAGSSGYAEYNQITNVGNVSQMTFSSGYVYANDITVMTVAKDGSSLTVSAGAALEVGNLVVTSADNAYITFTNHSATVNVDGGTLIANNFTAATDGRDAVIALNIRSGGSAVIGSLSAGTANFTTTLDNGNLRFYGGGTTDTNLVIASGGGTINVDSYYSTITHTGTLTGSGDLTKVSSGHLILGGAAAFTGRLIIEAGSVTLQGTTAATEISITQASYAGRATALYGNATAPAAALSLVGTFSPGTGEAAGTFTAASASFGATATASFQLGGTTPGTGHDQLVTSGLTSFAGTLSVTLIDGYTPTAGSSYTVFSAGSYSGAFSALNLPSGYAWDISRLASQGILAVSAIPEPASCATLLGISGLAFVVARRRRPSIR